MKRSNELDRTGEATIFEYLAARHLGKDATAELTAAAAQLDKSSWPYPAVEFYLGQRTAEDLLAAAATPEQRCEAQFLIAESFLLKDDADDATPALKAAIAACPQANENASQGAWIALMRIAPAR